MRCRGLRLARLCPGQPILGTARLDQLAEGPDLVDDLGLVPLDGVDPARQALDGGDILGGAGCVHLDGERRQQPFELTPGRAQALGASLQRGDLRLHLRAEGRSQTLRVPEPTMREI
jgi:hypothetical protein